MARQLQCVEWLGQDHGPRRAGTFHLLVSIPLKSLWIKFEHALAQPLFNFWVFAEILRDAKNANRAIT
jgi:hypothetical protein